MRVWILFIILALLGLTFYCLLEGQTVVGAPWQAWFVSIFAAWAFDKFLDWASGQVTTTQKKV